MSSIIDGYNYDIFISYRQKDNKHDGWVTEFVNHLNGELEATFKEDISIYFDENPSDGLLETHSVDKSLEDKLKCLIFIPVISQTYCDPTSFAWQHEFCVFNKLAKEDKLGRDIKLSSGNVTSRILPVKIHDLDPEDKTLLENELGGFIRGIEFIYKEPGVNRPLKPEDDEKKNLNNTIYRNQINKVANAVKEIIAAIKKHNQQVGDVPQEGVKAKPEKTKNLKTKIIVGSFILFALIVLGYLSIPKLNKPKEHLENSIAVLPFINDSPDQENAYFINGIMEEVLNNLEKIKDFRVLSRTSTDQYKGPDRPSIPEIAKELGVNYIIEGSGQKYGKTFRLRVQLIKAKGKETHLWAESYEQEIKEPKDIFRIQSLIAQTIATELKAVITPEEKQLIEKAPTSSITAYDFYQRGREEHWKYWSNNDNREALERAEDLYYKTLQYDSTFAQSYTGLAWVYWDKHYWGTFFSESFLDSVLILADIALSYDDQLAEAYTCKGAYYREMGNPDQAIEELDKAIKFNPNDWMTYSGKGELYSTYDLVKSIENYNKAISLNRGEQLPDLLRSISGIYANAGFLEKYKYYFQEAFKLDGDSSLYYSRLANYEFLLCNFAKSNEFYQKAYQIDTSYTDIQWSLGRNYMFLDQHEEALKHFKKWYEESKTLSVTFVLGMHRIGWAYWQNGYREKADYYFNEHINYCNKIDEMSRVVALPYREFYDLAGVYAFRGEKNKAYENLRICNKQQMMPLWVVTYIKNDPLFDSIRGEPEFQQIASDMEAKYQAEHERVGKWLEVNDML